MKYALSFTVQSGIVTSYMNNNIATCNSYSTIGEWDFCTIVFGSIEEYYQAVEIISNSGKVKKLGNLVIQ